jgi:hypothetical protein
VTRKRHVTRRLTAPSPMTAGHKDETRTACRPILRHVPGACGCPRQARTSVFRLGTTSLMSSSTSVSPQPAVMRRRPPVASMKRVRVASEGSGGAPAWTGSLSYQGTSELLLGQAHGTTDFAECGQAEALGDSSPRARWAAALGLRSSRSRSIIASAYTGRLAVHLHLCGFTLVEVMGFEPTTSSMRPKRSSQLSYTPVRDSSG